MIQDYVPLLLHIIVAIGFASVTMAMSILVGRAGRRNAVKDTAYECGVAAEGGPQPRFSVKFYLVAMLFILFDIEVVFMYPWAVAFREYVAQQGSMIFWSMLSFVLILLVAFVYAIKKGALSWK